MPDDRPRYVCLEGHAEDLTERFWAKVGRIRAGDVDGPVFRSRLLAVGRRSTPERVRVVCSEGHSNWFTWPEDADRR